MVVYFFKCYSLILEQYCAVFRQRIVSMDSCSEAKL